MDWEKGEVVLLKANECSRRSVGHVKHYFAYVATAPSVGAFSGLHFTLIVENEQVCSLSDVWNISKEVLSGFSGDEDVKGAVSRLSHLIGEGDGAALSEKLTVCDQILPSHLLRLVCSLATVDHKTRYKCLLWSGTT